MSEFDTADFFQTNSTPARLPAESFFDKNGLIVQALAEYVASDTRIVLGHDQRLYWYDGGVYRADGDTLVKVRVREALGERAKKRHGDEVVAHFRDAFPSISERPPAEWINVANGLLDWRTGELHPHSPDVMSTIQIPVAWNPDTTCPRIEKFLREVVPDDALDLALELFGYALYPANPMRKAVLLLGGGRNGKSTLLRLLRALVGARNTASVPLQVLAENRFAGAELFGKLANIAGDLDARAVRRSDLFKTITGGDAIHAERKFGHPFTFTSFALPVFAANEAPISSDQTDAWFDRWIIIPFERRFAKHEADPKLDEKLHRADEMEGLLVQAVAALRRLLERGRFEEPASVERAGLAYRDRLDTVRAFVAEECTLRADLWVQRKWLYEAYTDWARSSGRLPVSAVNFNDALRRNYAGTLTESKTGGVWVWRGIDRSSVVSPLATGVAP